MAYDPITDVSAIAMINVWDLREGMGSFVKCLFSLFDAIYTARQALGYAGKP